MRVAVLGTGIMGAPMARNLAKAGHDVTAWNRTREKAQPLAEDGIRVVASPQEAVEGAEAVVTMLADGDAVVAVMEELAPALSPEQVWWQCSTVGVDAAGRLGGLAGDVPYVDGPVLGTRGPAEQGKLTILASGSAAAKARCAPLFDATGATTVDLGDEAGAGSRMKLVLNNWLLALVEGLAESVALAEGLGVQPAQFLEIIDGGPLGPPYAKLKGTAMIERAYDPSFTLALAAKDAGLVAAAARDAGLDLPLAEAIGGQMRKAIDAGHGDEDMAATVEASRR